jgi:uncharacterized protein (TIGR03067 family)
MFGGTTVQYRSKEKSMRIALVTLLCAFGLVVSGGTGTRADDKADVEKELKKFQGAWTFESSESGGQKRPADQLKDLVLTFDGAKHTIKNGTKVIEVGTQKLDLSKSPKAIDVTVTEGPNKGAVRLGIYEIDGDTMRACFDMGGKKRPTEFESPPGSETLLNVHKRAKK